MSGQGACGPVGSMSAHVILLVDDDPDVLESLKSVLELSLDDVEVQTASSGEAGLVLLQHHRVELIISDYRMPGMNGAEFLEKAEEIAPGVPRILVSAFPDSVVRDQVSSRVHVEQILPKPMDIDRFVGLSKHYLR